MSDNSIPMTKAEKVIWEELKAQRKLLNQILENNSLDRLKDVSANKATKILKCGYETLMKEINSGNLKAKRRGNGIRILLKDLEAYQNCAIITPKIKHTQEKISAQQIWDDIQAEKKRGKHN